MGGLEFIPIVLVTSFLIAFFGTLILAQVFKTVRVYFPLLCSAGAIRPPYYLFVYFFGISGSFFAMTVVMQYLRLGTATYAGITSNNISLIMGLTAAIALGNVALWSFKDFPLLHNCVAGVFTFSGTFYMSEFAGAARIVDGYTFFVLRKAVAYTAIGITSINMLMMLYDARKHSRNSRKNPSSVTTGFLSLVAGIGVEAKSTGKQLIHGGTGFFASTSNFGVSKETDEVDCVKDVVLVNVRSSGPVDTIDEEKQDTKLVKKHRKVRVYLLIWALLQYVSILCMPVYFITFVPNFASMSLQFAF